MDKNRLIHALLFSLCFLPFALVFITSASFLEISEDLVIAGNGTIDRDFVVQSVSDLSGQKLTESIVPVYLPHEISTSSYRSNFELVLSDNSTILYESASELVNVKHELSNENFKLGVCTGFQFIGTQNKTFLFESSPSLSEALLASEAEGRSVLRARVTNDSQHHARYINSRTWLEGNYTLDWAFLALGIKFPEAGDDDYLVCP